jgi:hypothetical protein
MCAQLLALSPQLLRALRDGGPRLADEAARAAGEADTVAWVCALSPEAVSDWQKPLALSRAAVDAVDRTAWSAEAKARMRHAWLNTLAVVLYRAGRFEEALARLKQGMKESGGAATVEDWVVLTLVQHRLGNNADLGQGLRQARDWEKSRAHDADWLQRLPIRLLCAEAEALLGR